MRYLFINRYILLIFSFILLLISFNSCSRDKEISTDSETIIRLRWNKAYETETKNKVEIGLLWTLSSLGATLPKGSFENSTHWTNNILCVDINKVGFSEKAITKFIKLLQILKQSKEYRVYNSIDIGRFVMLTINSSNHYYEIIGTKKTLAEFKRDKYFDERKAIVTRSSISSKTRVIMMPDTNSFTFKNTAYVSMECNSYSPSNTCIATEKEVFQLLPNGQFGFGIYDEEDKLIAASEGGAGKIAKCFWCHEIYIQTLYKSQDAVSGFYSEDETKRLINKRFELVQKFRNTLNGDIDFSKTYDHTYMELLYVTFMEPSVERLSHEWNITQEEVLKRTSALKKHTNKEYVFLPKVLFDRNELENISNLNSIRVPESAREKSEYEPNLIQ